MTNLSPDVEALLDESYESDLTEEESEELLLLCGHGIGPKLSPAAQAVLNAASGTYGNYQFTARGQMIAAAFRVAAAHLPSSAMYPSSDWGHGWRAGINDARQALLTIAAELEGNNG